MDFNIYSVKFKRNRKITHQTVDRPMQPGQDNVHWISIEFEYVFDVSYLLYSYTESNICNCLKI